MTAKTKQTMREIATLTACFTATSAFILAQSIFWS